MGKLKFSFELTSRKDFTEAEALPDLFKEVFGDNVNVKFSVKKNYSNKLYEGTAENIDLQAMPDKIRDHVKGKNQRLASFSAREV